jgi:hypothetical protein
MEREARAVPKGAPAFHRCPEPSVRRRRCFALGEFVEVGLRGLRGAFEGGGEHFVELVDEDEFELVADLFRDLVEVGFVSFGDEDALDAGAVGGERLFLEAADGEDAVGLHGS